ncbi:30S ribosomal protein S15 [Candidatus Gracilibacteria bacterium]|nr:30S ribosomal protein S15 [Candidatus Gracilibacteria bacterium]
MATAKKTTKKPAAKEAEPVHVKQDKKEVMKTHQLHGKDTGSAPVQIAILTEKINSLAAHLKAHPQDKHSRRGLIGMVGKRRKLLKYLQMTSQAMYTKIVQALKLRK